VCGDQIGVAAFAQVRTPTTVPRMSPVVATSMGGNYVIRCEAPIRQDEARRCTMEAHHWQQLVSSGQAPQAWSDLEDVQMCGFLMQKILFGQLGTDAWPTLAQQYITAKLNVANGAPSTEEIDTAMTTAAMFLSPCEIGAAIKQDALALAQTLAAYNMGEIGPGACVE
jgi:hypothetical protein